MRRAAQKASHVSYVTDMKKTTCFFWITVLLLSPRLNAQGYQALHGSAFTGSTAVFNNPASSVHSAYKWDLTLFSIQGKISTRSAYLKNFSFANQDSSRLTLREGMRSQYVHASFDASLLNFLYRIDEKHAVNFGLRARSYIHSKSLPFMYADSISSFNSFLVTNANTAFLQAFGTQTGWLEADLNYSQVLVETNHSRLSGGITLQVMKGMSGAFIRLNKLSYLQGKNGNQSYFTFTNGSGSAGYSANFDQSSFKEYYKNSLGSLGLSLGAEYMTYADEDNAYAGNTCLNYDWKIGVSLMDLGANRFKASANSLQFYDPNPLLGDGTIDNKLSGAGSLAALKDSLKTIFNSTADITDNFSISNPTRLIVNIDKNLGNHFYINGEMSMNFYATGSYTKLRTRELNLLTITPRWETLGLGAYLPVQYNTQGQLWIGAALKAGPLVMGVHSLGILKKDPSINGGFYLLLSVHPFNQKQVLGKMDCPE